MSCVGGCGFHGNPNTFDLCSKCYRDMLQQSDNSTQPSKPRRDAESELRTEWQVADSGVTIAVRIGDLTVEQVDAVVNAANDSLDHAAGLL